jgi:hypothetical protein
MPRSRRGQATRGVAASLDTSFGVPPLSVALAALAVQHFGPVPTFPLAGGTLAVAVVFGLTQWRLRDFGTAGPVLTPTHDADQAALADAATSGSGPSNWG